MNILRLSTLSLALAIAVMTLGYVNPSFADPPPHGHGGGGDPPPPSITYTAELQGAFVFGPLDVTLEGQDSRLRAAVDAIMTRAGSTEQATWDNVFGMPQATGPCNLFGSPGAVLSFTALKKEKHVKGWRISRPGGVYVLFGGELITDPGSVAEGALVHVSLQLIGDCSYSSEGSTDCDPFLPDPSVVYGDDDPPRGLGISEIPLTRFDIHAKALKGSPQFEGCHTAQADLLVPSTLVITATAP